MDKHKKGIVLTIISVAVLLVSSLMMFVDTGSAQGASDWSATWTPAYDRDHKRFYINLRDVWKERHACFNRDYSGCVIGDLANNHVFTAPPTVVSWLNNGTINQGGSTFSYQETWIAGDGLGSEIDFSYRQEGFAGQTGGRHHSWALFTGDARLKGDGYGWRLEYRWIFASEDNATAFPLNCRDENYIPEDCEVWLAWGDLPGDGQWTPGQLSNADWKSHLAIWSRIDSGMPKKWTVTGNII